MVSNRGYHGSAKANRQITCAWRKQRRNKKGQPQPPWFLLNATVLRDEIPPLRVRSGGKHK